MYSHVFYTFTETVILLLSYKFFLLAPAKKRFAVYIEKKRPELEQAISKHREKTLVALEKVVPENEITRLKCLPQKKAAQDIVTLIMCDQEVAKQVRESFRNIEPDTVSFIIQCVEVAVAAGLTPDFTMGKMFEF